MSLLLGAREGQNRLAFTLYSFFVEHNKHMETYKDQILKAKQGVIQFYFRKINKNFWWIRFFLIRCGCRDIKAISKLKLPSAFHLTT